MPVTLHLFSQLNNCPRCACATLVVTLSSLKDLWAIPAISTYRLFNESLLWHFFPFYLFIYLFIYLFLWPHLQHIEVSRPGVDTYAYATATPDLSLHLDLHLHFGLWHCQIFNPLVEARDGTHILTDTL